jgi:hypothetical protein
MAAGFTFQNQIVLAEFIAELFDFETVAHRCTVALCGCANPLDKSYSIPSSE